MKILKVTEHYPNYLKYFYQKNPTLHDASYIEQKKAMDFDGYAWADYWSQATKPLGYHMEELVANAESLQRAWAVEQGYNTKMSLHDIVLEQAKKCMPDILWFDCTDEILLQKLKAAIKSVRFTMGWTGSAVNNVSLLKKVDLVLSCAPEVVETLGRDGLKAQHLNHAFDPRINDRIHAPQVLDQVIFIGQFVRAKHFHLNRERILEDLTANIDVKIYSPAPSSTVLEKAKGFLRRQAYSGIGLGRKMRIPESLMRRIPIIGRAVEWESQPCDAINPRLKTFIYPPVFGLDMYQAIKNSSVVLNIHADSSPHYASNMRLFEITGVGSCMVVDWKSNIADLFEPDKEVVTFKSPEECIGKITWLLEHPLDRKKIAEAGQKRCLKEHTFGERAKQLDMIIKKAI